jgi:hypothetical protein
MPVSRLSSLVIFLLRKLNICTVVYPSLHAFSRDCERVATIRDPAMIFPEWEPTASDIAAFVDGCGEYRTAVLAVPDWVLGPTAKK